MNQVTINLSDTSEMYEQFRYPAGEWQVRLKPETLAMIRNETGVRVIARIAQAEDIVKLALLRSALLLPNDPRLSLVLPYLPYSRADRRFTEGDCAGLGAFGTLIRSLAFDEVFTLDAHHQPAAMRAIRGLIDRAPTAFIHRAIGEFAGRQRAERISILFPDEGARLRYHIPAELSSNTARIALDVFHGSKKRDAVTGVLTGFEVPALPDQPALIVDDICDGGGTFVGLAKEMGDVPKGLYVTHGIFSKGLEPLLLHFEDIYTTNSFREYAEFPRHLTVYDALPELQ